MAESSRRFRKSTSRSIAATSAIALALGGISVVGPGPLAPYAAAASGFTGGIRDKSGAVETDPQQRDLPAGSCVVNSGKPSGSQAGFSWNTLEPGSDSPSKTLWGLSVSFDNSKDRTFADWYFSNSGNLSNVLDAGQVPSMEAGTDFPVKPPLPVTAKADESIDITASGRSLRNLNVYAELTDEKVKEFASATADDPVRYAWQSNYKKYDPNEPKATEGDNATFGATVNPWPSENIECNPITVSWEESQRFVVNPGNENKVGHINVPELLGEGGGTDDSLSRMVVEAYDEDGNLIGTSDAKASGGEQNLRIDDNGDIFFTWPKYVDSDHATDKNVNFSVFAQPRSVGELQAAAEHNNNGIGEAFNASNSLDRYSKANVVDSGGVALDNTDLHNPKYDENEKHITSEVGENGTGEDEGRHVVTFTPVVDPQGNTLQDLVEKFNATVELDEDASNIYENWDAELNDDYTVTVKSPGGKDTRPGTFAQPMVKVTYSNGSTDIIPLLVIVDPNNTQTTDVEYPKTNSRGEPGKPMRASGTPTRILGKGNPVTPATYAIKNAPAGWDVTVADDGTITAIPPADAKPGDFATVDLTVTYPDGTIDTPSTTFVVGERKNKDDADPTFPEKTVYPDEETTSPLAVEKPDDLEFAETDPFVIDPEAEEFAPTGELNDFGNPIYKFETENGDWFVSLDDNGDVISKIPATAQPGDQVNVPVKVTYADGSYDMANAPIVVVDNKREVPFEIEYKFDPNLPAGQYDVREKGVPGEEVLLRDETWNRTKDPKNEVVYIGIKPPEASEDVKWTVPIPFPTEVRENLDLAPGETKVVQEGENGEKTYTAKFTAKGDQAQVAEEETNKDPVKRIIEVGPRLDAQELVTKTEKPIPFETEIEFDDTLAAGEQVVDEQGELGTEVSTSTQKLVDGKPSGDPTVTTEQTKAPKNAKIRVGTKTTGETSETVTSEVPFGVKVVLDPDMPAGTSETVTEGVPGEKTVTIKRDIVNSKPGDPQITEEITKDPVDQVIKVGTKPSKASEKVSWTAQVPFEVETRPNPELKPGEIKVAQEGVPGEKTYTADFTAKGTEATVTPEEKQTKDPVKEIIEYGPAAEDTSVVTKTEKPVPFETEIVFDDSLAAGEQVVDQQGELGTDVVTSTQQIVDGKPSGDPVVTTERTKEPTEQIIRVGTKTTGENTESVESEIPFGVRVEFDPNMPAGASEIVTEGKPGKKTTTVTQNVTNSQPDGEATVEEKITAKPVDQVIKVGTKPSEASENVTWTAQVPFEVETRPNPELKPGEIKIAQKGVPGEKTYTADFTATGDQATVTPEEKQTKDPVKEIIEYGPTPEDTAVVTKTEKPVPFETEIVFDDTLAEGEQVVDQQGELGTDVVTSTQQIVDGKPSGDPVVTTERTKEPTEQIIRVGTKTTGENTESVESEIPFGVKVEFDPNMPAGTSETVTEGKPGKKTVTITRDVTNSTPGEPTISEEVTEDPVDQVIKVGTKPSEASENVTWTAQVPFEVETRPNPELKPGEIKVAQEGVPGEKTYTADFTATGDQATVTPEEKQTKDPVNEIIEYGPAPEDTAVVTKTEKPVPFETEIVFDDTLAAGEQVIDTQGEYGTDVVTSTQKLVDGKPSGDPVVTTERTKEPTNAVIRVGSKTSDTPVPAPEVSETVALPYTTKIVFDPTLEPGQEIEDVKGVDGEVKVSFVDGKASAETVKEPVQRVVRVGSKPGATTEWTEETPFEVKVVVDPELEAGKYETVQEGKPGQIVHRTDGTEDITPAVDHIIKVGTKKVITNPFEFTTVQPYSTTVRPNFDLQPGERKVVQEGVNGFVRFKIDITTGEVDKLEESREIERIVEYGPAKTDDEAVTKVTRPVPFDTEIVEDPNLPEGVQTFEQGEVGEEIVTTTQPLKDGKPYGDPKITTEQTKAPRNAIIRVGTKTPATPEPLPEFSETVELPYTTKIVWDPTLEPGQEIEDVAGVNGLVEARVTDGKLTLETVKEPVQRVVRVGSKPADGAEWTEQIPFQVQVRQNPELNRGESRVVQNGVAGLKRYVDGVGEVVSEPVDYIFEIGTKDLTEQPAYSAVALSAGQTAEVALSTGHVQGNGYRKLDWPEGWEGSVDPETGLIRVTPPADAKPGTKVSLPVEVTDANGDTFTVNAEVAVYDNGEVTPTPEDDKASSDKARRCLANAFAANSPFLWLLPLGILGAVGYGVNEAFGPQIQQLNAQFDEAVRRNMPDFGVGHGVEKPEFVREIEGQVNAINQRFAPVAEQLQPVGIALGAIALLSLTGVLVAQACSEDGFDNGLTVLGSSKDDNTAEAARSSKK